MTGVVVINATEIQRGALEANHHQMVEDLRKQMGDFVDAQLRKAGEEGLTDGVRLRGCSTLLEMLPPSLTCKSST